VRGGKKGCALLKRVDADAGEHLRNLEYELALRWRHYADSHALETLLRRFWPQVKNVASGRYAAHGLDGLAPREKRAALKDLFASGRLGLIEAITRYDGRGPLAAYSYWWIKKRCEECARFIKNEVHRHERRKVQTIPIERFDEPRLVDWQLDQHRTLKCSVSFLPINPFENPYSIDYTPSRDISYSTPIENHDNDLVPEEWLVGRLNASSKDVENDIDGANLFDSDEVQAAAYESAAAEARALGVETLALMCLGIVPSKERCATPSFGEQRIELISAADLEAAAQQCLILAHSGLFERARLTSAFGGKVDVSPATADGDLQSI